MNAEHLQKRLSSSIRKLGAYKYALLILLLGIGLMLMPQKQKTQETAKTAELPAQRELEMEIAAILEQMDGAGSVRVLLTMREGPSYAYQTDEQLVTDQYGSETQTQTVLVDDGSGRETPVPVRTGYPVYQGALILCEGADRASVRLNIVNAVSDLTGLDSSRISVIKMKEH